jgi:catecholate siderophore receptor
LRPYCVAILVAALGFAGSAAAAPPPTVEQATYRFDIPAGSVASVVARFEALTNLRVAPPPDVDLRQLTSPGVSGVLRPEEALQQLLTGTGLTFRTNVAGGFALAIAVAPEVVAVTGTFSPYRAEQSASATKTATPLRDIPQTVSVVPREVLIDQRAQSVADAVRNAAGVTIAQGEGNRDQIVLRGISTASDFYVNGVRDDQERFRDLYNVESVEVVQGPAAVLFGRGGAGGVVNLVTRRPARGAPSDASIEFGAYDHKRATTQFGVPVGDAGSLRISAMAEDSGGFRDAYFLHRYAVNPVVGLRLGPSSDLTLGFEHLRDHRLADRGIPSRNGRPVDVRSSQLFGSALQNDAKSGVDSAYATFEHRFKSGVIVRNTLLFGRYDKSYQNVYPGSAVSAADTLTLSAYNHDIDRKNAFNQTDVLFSARTGRVNHTLLAGMEVGHQFQDELRHTAQALTNVPLNDSMRDASFATAPLAIDRHASSDVAAGYVQDQIELSARWKALVGARLDRFNIGVDDHLPTGTDLSRTDVALSPRAGLIYQPVRNTSIYGSYSYTFLPSGQTLGLTPTTAVVGPENAKNYEVGVKADVLQNRLGVALAVFRLDRDNVKNTDPLDSARVVLTGQQRTDGVSLSVTGNITPSWRVYGGYANLNARITADTVAAPAGRRVGLAPRNQLTLWTTRDFGQRLGAGVGVVSQSSMYTSFSNQVRLPSFTRADALVYYRLGRYRLAANVENLFNARYYPTANSDNNISPGSPRNVQISLRATF